jgi:hypothetical protein
VLYIGVYIGVYIGIRIGIYIDIYKDIYNNNNKFNLPPVLVPLVGLYRLIPSIGKTLT